MSIKGVLPFELNEETKRLFDDFNRLQAIVKGIKKDRSRFLTMRELEILILLCEGKKNREIGKKLFISVRTVDVHRRNILMKVGVRNNVELLRAAIKDGIVTI